MLTAFAWSRAAQERDCGLADLDGAAELLGAALQMQRSAEFRRVVVFAPPG